MLTVTKPIQLTFITERDIGDYVFQIHFENIKRAAITRVVTAESRCITSLDRHKEPRYISDVFVDVYNVREQDVNCYTVKPYIMDNEWGAVDEKKKIIHIILCYDKSKEMSDYAVLQSETDSELGIDQDPEQEPIVLQTSGSES